ncbi:MAG: phage DNA packaging protein J [Planctomycetes bacterium]|nr:phage DNA packaging protein J [Planctomycetota bacterium]
MRAGRVLQRGANRRSGAHPGRPQPAHGERRQSAHRERDDRQPDDCPLPGLCRHGRRGARGAGVVPRLRLGRQRR